MNDPLRHGLGRLEAPVRPDPRFADALFGRLIEEAGDHPARGRLGDPLRRAPDRFQRLLIAAAALLVAGAVFALTLPSLRPTNGTGVGGVGPTPAFRAIVEFTVASQPIDSGDEPLVAGPHRIEVVYAGPDAWRIEVLDDGLGGAVPDVAGSFGAWDGERFQIYDAGLNAIHEMRIASSAFTILNPLAWRAPGAGWDEICRVPEEQGSDVVLGRTVTRIACDPSSSIELWVDPETALVLRVEVAAGAESLSFEGPIGPGPGGGFRFLELELDRITPADAAFDPPAGAGPAEDVEVAPTTLTVGAPVPPLPGLAEQGLALPPVDADVPAAIYVWATWCPPCTGDALSAFDAQVAALAPALDAFAVAYRDDPDLPMRLFMDGGYQVALLNDVEGELMDWGIEGIPTLVLLDAQGRFLGAYAGALEARDLEAVLQAVVAGEPLPEVAGVTSQRA